MAKGRGIVGALGDFLENVGQGREAGRGVERGGTPPPGPSGRGGGGGNGRGGGGSGGGPTGNTLGRVVGQAGGSGGSAAGANPPVVGRYSGLSDEELGNLFDSLREPSPPRSSSPAGMTEAEWDDFVNQAAEAYGVGSRPAPAETPPFGDIRTDTPPPIEEINPTIGQLDPRPAGGGPMRRRERRPLGQDGGKVLEDTNAWKKAVTRVQRREAWIRWRRYKLRNLVRLGSPNAAKTEVANEAERLARIEATTLHAIADAGGPPVPWA